MIVTLKLPNMKSSLRQLGQAVDQASDDEQQQPQDSSASSELTSFDSPAPEPGAEVVAGKRVSSVDRLNGRIVIAKRRWSGGPRAEPGRKQISKQ